ncbi:NAD-dependent epimerase/dehydratase family protein [Pedobacter sp. MR22-3]|uniref:NAD-dependent epimerase/dehydratase family protein n=1 Tax=Pedobacter sp. MR22-3 TaxID=2994552 RepID=UPI0022469F99|nr:NAD-dependent epimerase/dehydratase family protein [Pedobacter sp. MR22-3]MCX2582890.1 NAD-dependent epimerase/dehydratase family protein [Pedobacter sp. MR22-3]
MRRVLITGITGFLGSHIGEILNQNNIEIIGLKRSTSDLSRCISFADEIKWIDLDHAGEWKQQVILQSPTEIIHCAWIGVEANDRNQWSLQAKNIELLVDLLEITQSLNLKKFIFLGSQAEYGNISRKVSEDDVVHPMSAYASIKLSCLQILKTYSELNHINWLWLRVFSVFGEKESDNWLIPSVINKMKTGTEMDFTGGEQQYAYLYAGDFAKILLSIVEREIKSGIYNVSGNHTLTLRSLLSQIRDKVNPSFQLNFGAIPYRQNQSMHIQGDITKLTDEIGVIDFTDFNVALSKTLNYYLSK